VRIVSAALLMLAGSAAADQVDVWDHVSGYRMYYTDCVVDPLSTDFLANCGGIYIEENGDKPPVNPEIWPALAVGIRLNSGFAASWGECRMTEVAGLPGGGVYTRLDCMLQPKLFKNGFEPKP
jgi:hypothetical protein